MSGSVLVYSVDKVATFLCYRDKTFVNWLHTGVCGKVERGTVQNKLGKNTMVGTEEYSVAWEVLGYSIDELWHYPVPGVSCGPAPCQEMHQVLSWG